MSGLILCGKRTANPYVIKQSDIRIYTIEELCYYLYNNTYMVDTDFFTVDLVNFINTELALPSLAQRMKYHVDHRANLSTMVMEILSGSDYYDDDEKKAIEKLLIALGSKSKSERMKAMADMLLERNKYISAINAYKDILNSPEEKYSNEFIAEIWNNIGVIYTKQFMFKNAQACFKNSYDVDKKEEYFDNLVCATIFTGDDDMIADLAAQYLISDETIEHYIKAIESNRNQIIKKKEFAELKERLVYDGSKILSEYKQDVQKVLDKWKEDYRQAST